MRDAQPSRIGEVHKRPGCLFNRAHTPFTAALRTSYSEVLAAAPPRAQCHPDPLCGVTIRHSWDPGIQVRAD